MGTSIELAQFLLVKAVDLDEKGRWTESFNYYQEGISKLLEYVRDIKDKRDQEKLRERIESYMKRAEELKEKLEIKKKVGNYHEQIEIENNSKDHSYEQMFGRFLGDDVECVQVTDPYIHKNHQCYNFLQFCELLIKKCPNIKRINLITTPADKPRDGSKELRQQQENNLDQIKTSLKKYKIILNINYSNTLHDREIVLSNDWIIKIGRGLDYFKVVPDFSIGSTDLSLRECKQTTVDIFHKTALIK